MFSRRQIFDLPYIPSSLYPVVLRNIPRKHKNGVAEGLKDAYGVDSYRDQGHEPGRMDVGEVAGIDYSEINSVTAEGGL